MTTKFAFIIQNYIMPVQYRLNKAVCSFENNTFPTNCSSFKTTFPLVWQQRKPMITSCHVMSYHFKPKIGNWNIGSSSLTHTRPSLWYNPFNMSPKWYKSAAVTGVSSATLSISTVVGDVDLIRQPLIWFPYNYCCEIRSKAIIIITIYPYLGYYDRCSLQVSWD